MPRSRTTSPGSQSEHPPDLDQPLFLASQLSSVDVDKIKESGLGIEAMNAEEFAAMLDAEGEEVNFDPSPDSVPCGNGIDEGSATGQVLEDDDLEYMDSDEDSTGMGPTQLDTGSSHDKVGLL